MQIVIKIKNNDGLELLTITKVLHTNISIHTNVSKADKRAIT